MLLRRKDNTSRNPDPHDRVVWCYHWISTSWLENVITTPFCMQQQSLSVQSIQSPQDRLTHVQLLFTWNPSRLSLQSSHLNICYYHQDLQHVQFRIDFHHVFNNKHMHPPTHHASSRTNRLVSVARFSAIHFRGKSIRQVSCYTFLSGFQLPWPPSCC